MSSAQVSTVNRMGFRTLSGFRPRPVYRAPAEAPPRATQNVQNITLGAFMESGAAQVVDGGNFGSFWGARPIAIGPRPVVYNPPLPTPVVSSQSTATPIAALPATQTLSTQPVASPVFPTMIPPAYSQPPPSTAAANGSASQNATGSVASSSAAWGITGQVTPISSPPTPTSVATFDPVTNPGMLQISSGGGSVTPVQPTASTSPDYFSEAAAWLTSNTLIAAVPNWIPLVGVAAVLLMISKPGHKR